MTTSTPLVEEISPAIDPVEALEKLCDLPWVLFLDSAATDTTHGRYSYLCARPVRTIREKDGQILIEDVRGDELTDAGYEVTSRAEANVFDVLGAELQRSTADRVPDLPPFQGGAAGLFGYGLSRTVERIPGNCFDEFKTADLAIGIYEWVIGWDHERGTCHLFSHTLLNKPDGARLDHAASRIREIVERLSGPPRTPRASSDRTGAGDVLPASALAPSWELPGQPQLRSNFNKSDYLRTVARSIEYIHAGDVFQVNLSQRLIHPARSTPLEFYLRLRQSNPAPFAGYFDPGDFVVASSSPEQFLSLEDGEVTTRPIKGTRSRGYTAEEDVYRRIDLCESEKDRAENVMIVDLLRNDLSRVCRPHSVQVPRLFELERHPTVHHLVSEVRGQLREDCSAIDLLRTSFPGGSITGAPKVRAMEIISELEPTARGPYCGSLVWIGFDGGMGSNILIRTVTISRGWLQLPVGGGITADSRPEAEYQETLDKAAGMVWALADR